MKKITCQSCNKPFYSLTYENNICGDCKKPHNINAMQSQNNKRKHNEIQSSILDSSDDTVKIKPLANNLKWWQGNFAFSRWIKFIQFPKTQTEHYLPLNFKIFDWRKIGFVFLLTSIFVPILIDALFAIIYSNKAESPSINSLRLLLRLAIIIIPGIIIGSKVGFGRSLKSGGAAFYIYVITQNVIGFFLGGIVVALFKGLSADTNNLILAILNIIADLLPLIFILLFCDYFIHKWKLIWKFNRKRFLIFTPLAIAFAILMNLAFGYLQGLISPGESANQQTINNIMNTWYNTLLIGILTIIIAPLVEEMAMRHGIFTLSGNPMLGWIASCLFFAELHISSSNNWSHIIAYLGGGLALTTIFVVFQYNVYISILAHAGMNSAAFIMILVVR